MFFNQKSSFNPIVCPPAISPPLDVSPSSTLNFLRKHFSSCAYTEAEPENFFSAENVANDITYTRSECAFNKFSQSPTLQSVLGTSILDITLLKLPELLYSAVRTLNSTSNLSDSVPISSENDREKKQKFAALQISLYISAKATVGHCTQRKNVMIPKYCPRHFPFEPNIRKFVEKWRIERLTENTEESPMSVKSIEDADNSLRFGEYIKYHHMYAESLVKRFERYTYAKYGYVIGIRYRKDYCSFEYFVFKDSIRQSEGDLSPTEHYLCKLHEISQPNSLDKESVKQTVRYICNRLRHFIRRVTSSLEDTKSEDYINDTSFYRPSHTSSTLTLNGKSSSQCPKNGSCLNEAFPDEKLLAPFIGEKEKPIQPITPLVPYWYPTIDASKPKRSLKDPIKETNEYENGVSDSDDSTFTLLDSTELKHLSLSTASYISSVESELLSTIKSNSNYPSKPFAAYCMASITAAETEPRSLLCLTTQQTIFPEEADDLYVQFMDLQRGRHESKRLMYNRLNEEDHIFDAFEFNVDTTRKWSHSFDSIGESLFTSNLNDTADTCPSNGPAIPPSSAPRHTLKYTVFGKRVKSKIKRLQVFAKDKQIDESCVTAPVVDAMSANTSVLPMHKFDTMSATCMYNWMENEDCKSKCFPLLRYGSKEMAAYAASFFGKQIEDVNRLKRICIGGKGDEEDVLDLMEEEHQVEGGTSKIIEMPLQLNPNTVIECSDASIMCNERRDICVSSTVPPVPPLPPFQLKASRESTSRSRIQNLMNGVYNIRGTTAAINANIRNQRQPYVRGIYYERSRQLWRVQFIENSTIRTKCFSANRFGGAGAKQKAAEFWDKCHLQGILY